MKNFRKKVPANRYVLLDYTTGLVFKRRNLEKFISSAYEQGFSRLGDLVQLDHRQLQGLAGNEAALGRVLGRLHEIGLDIESAAPGWQSPDEPRKIAIRKALHDQKLG